MIHKNDGDSWRRKTKCLYSLYCKKNIYDRLQDNDKYIESIYLLYQKAEFTDQELEIIHTILNYHS